TDVICPGPLYIADNVNPHGAQPCNGDGDMRIPELILQRSPNHSLGTAQSQSGYLDNTRLWQHDAPFAVDHAGKRLRYAAPQADVECVARTHNVVRSDGDIERRCTRGRASTHRAHQAPIHEDFRPKTLQTFRRTWNLRVKIAHRHQVVWRRLAKHLWLVGCGVRPIHVSILRAGQA